MDRHVAALLTISLLSARTVPTCVADLSTILFRFGMVPTHYEMYAENKYVRDSDPLNTISLDGRRILCYTVMNAKQFTHVYNPKYYDQHEENPYIGLKKVISTNMAEGADSSSSSSTFTVQDCAIRRRSDLNFQRIKCLRCVDTKKVKWFIALSPTEKYMLYLLEPTTYEESHFFRITGLFEPSAIRDENVSLVHFYDQLQNALNEMETICQLGQIDRLRACSAVFKSLDDEETLQDLNYIKVQRRCRKCFVQRKDSSFIRVNAVPCSMNADVEYSSTLRPFYLLADSRHPGAAFVFDSFEETQGLPLLTSFTRVTNLSALIYPIGVRGKTQRPKKKVNDKKKGKQKRRRKMDSEETDSGDTSEGNSDWACEEDETRSMRNYKSEHKVELRRPDLGEIASDSKELIRWGTRNTEFNARGKIRQKEHKILPHESKRMKITDEHVEQWTGKGRRCSLKGN